MKENILKIINNEVQFMQAGKRERLATEITSHIMEFVGWLRETPPHFLARMNIYTNTDCYNYWLENIKDPQ